MDIENLKQDYPEMPDSIRDMIQMEVDKEMNKREKTGFMKAAVAVLAVLMVMGGTAYAANRLYNIYIEKEAAYSVNITYNSAVSDECQVALTGDGWKGSEIPKVTLSVDYVPEGMVIADGMEDYTVDGDNIVQKVIIGTQEQPFNSGVSFGFETLESATTFTLHEKYVKDAKEIEINGNPAVYIEYNQEKELNYTLYVFYQEFPYVLAMTVFEGTDLDTAVQIAEGLKLTVTEDEHARHLVDAPVYTPAVEEAEQTEEEEVEVLKGSVTATAEQMENTHAIGESFDYQLAYGGMVTAKVSSVMVCDNFSMLDSEAMESQGFAPEQYLDNEGKLLPDTLQYIQYGNGTDALDEVVKTEEVNEKFVYIAIDYTNNTDTVKKDILYNVKISYIREERDILTIVDPLEGVEADGVAGTIYGYRHIPKYTYNGKDAEEKNNIMNLQPGDTQTVYVGFFVPENMLPFMYLNLNGNADEVQQTFDKESLEIGYVDIRQ